MRRFVVSVLLAGTVLGAGALPAQANHGVLDVDYVREEVEYWSGPTQGDATAAVTPVYEAVDRGLNDANIGDMCSHRFETCDDHPPSERTCIFIPFRIEYDEGCDR